MPEPDIKLYWTSGSPPCWRVLIALKEKGLAYKDKLLSMSNKEHKSKEVLALNPRGQMPTATFDGAPVNESLAAVDYIERRYGDRGTKLMPDDPKEQAAVVQRMHETHNCHKTWVENTAFYLLSTSPDDRKKNEVEQKKQNFRTELNRWEGYLEQNPPGWHIATKNFSLADVAFYPYLAFMVRLGLPLQRVGCHRLSSYYDMVSNRPSVKSTSPPHWKNSPGPDVFGNLFTD